MVRAYFVLNLGGVSAIVLLLLTYFIRQKDEAYRLLHIEEEKADNLLLNILPKEIAAILKNEKRTIADSFDAVSILFADLVGFTPLTANMPPVEVVNLLNEIFSYFDSLVEKYDVEKIRTIGDNYMVAAGAPTHCPEHACRLASMALEMQAYIRERRWSQGLPIEFRIGINSGPVIGGVIGQKKFVYDIWGDAVNIASRMESQGVAGRIQLTNTTYELIRDHFDCEQRGTVEVKGRGVMETWFLIGLKGPAQ
jgi:guanylate cyclase